MVLESGVTGGVAGAGDPCGRLTQPHPCSGAKAAPGASGARADTSKCLPSARVRSYTKRGMPSPSRSGKVLALGYVKTRHAEGDATVHAGELSLQVVAPAG